MGSFWKGNPCSPTWKGFIESYIYGYPPRLIESSPPILPIKLQGMTIRFATASDTEQLPDFWTRFFSGTGKTRCIVPLLHIQAAQAKARWTIIVVVKDEIVIGSIVRRWTKLHIKETAWQKAGIIDYFCIHPAYRKKGIGRALLSCLHNVTERPIQPHLMLLEGVQVTMPPISVGVYLSRRCIGSGVANKIKDEAIWRACVKGVGTGLWTPFEEGETTLWNLGQGSLAIWNTFHYSIPDGLKIGIVVGYTSLEAATAAAQTTAHGFGVLLLPVPVWVGLEGWTLDSPFQWLAYNTDVGFIESFPAVCI
jgi:GNAT superfamily N-acetyltransferase